MTELQRWPPPSSGRRWRWGSRFCCRTRRRSLSLSAFVHWYEEPTLRRQLGNQYEAYRRAVPGWWPRREPWEARNAEHS